VTAVEIDPVIVQVAHEYMGVAAEATSGRARSRTRARSPERGNESFDVIEVDLFAGGGRTRRSYCLTTEFLPGGAGRGSGPRASVSLNVYAPGAGDRTLARRMAGSLTAVADVFPHRPELPSAEERGAGRVSP